MSQLNANSHHSPLGTSELSDSEERSAPFIGAILDEYRNSSFEGSNVEGSSQEFVDFAQDREGIEDAEGFSPAELWAACIEFLRAETDTQFFQAYLAPLTFLGFDPDGREFSLGAPSRVVATQVEDRYGSRIREILGQEFAALTGAERNGMTLLPKLHFSVINGIAQPEAKESRYVVMKRPRQQGQVGQGQAGQGQVGGREASAEQEAGRSSFPVAEHRPTSQPRPMGEPRPHGEQSSRMFENEGAGIGGDKNSLNPRYTFDNFVVGNSNQFCHAAAMRVAENPGHSYNPLFIYGGVGLGKTHLLHSIGNAVLGRNPHAQVLYLSSEAFTNELIQSLRYARMEEFKRRLRNIEVLLIDDIQFIIGKERTQEEFFHTFNALYSAKRQIVITSDKIPSEIDGIEERLQTRFSWGLTADLQAPDFETRVAILKRKAFLEGFVLPEDVAHLIAEKISSNVRELEGALTRLHALSSLQHMPITMKTAIGALKPLLQPKTVEVSVDDIKKAVAQHFNLKVSDMVSKRRTKNLSFPRHIAMYLCRKHTTASYPEIGGQFGGRDHSSVIHAATVVSTKVSTDLKVKDIIEEIERRLFGGSL